MTQFEFIDMQKVPLVGNSRYKEYERLKRAEKLYWWMSILEDHEKTKESTEHLPYDPRLGF